MLLFYAALWQFIRRRTQTDSLPPATRLFRCVAAVHGDQMKTTLTPARMPAWQTVLEDTSALQLLRRKGVLVTDGTDSLNRLRITSGMSHRGFDGFPDR